MALVGDKILSELRSLIPALIDIVQMKSTWALGKKHLEPMNDRQP